jgi:hypothetical protein
MICSIKKMQPLDLLSLRLGLKKLSFLSFDSDINLRKIIGGEHILEVLAPHNRFEIFSSHAVLKPDIIKEISCRCFPNVMRPMCAAPLLPLYLPTKR